MKNWMGVRVSGVRIKDIKAMSKNKRKESDIESLFKIGIIFLKLKREYKKLIKTTISRQEIRTVSIILILPATPAIIPKNSKKSKSI